VARSDDPVGLVAAAAGAPNHCLAVLDVLVSSVDDGCSIGAHERLGFPVEIDFVGSLCSCFDFGVGPAHLALEHRGLAPDPSPF
jgi:hypothetical protein